MRETIIDQDIPLANDKRLIKKLWKVDKSEDYKNGLEYVYEFLYLKAEEWIHITRIDNQLHEGKAGAPIHILNKRVKWENLSFEEAEERIIQLSETIIRKIR